MTVGDRVVMTPEGYESLVKPWNRRASCRITIGTVLDVEYGQATGALLAVKVLRDGLKTPDHYAAKFWEKAT